MELKNTLVAIAAALILSTGFAQAAVVAPAEQPVAAPVALAADGLRCTICLEPIAHVPFERVAPGLSGNLNLTNDPVITFACSHVPHSFHRACAIAWRLSNPWQPRNECPGGCGRRIADTVLHSWGILNQPAPAVVPAPALEVAQPAAIAAHANELEAAWLAQRQQAERARDEAAQLARRVRDARVRARDEAEQLAARHQAEQARELARAQAPYAVAVAAVDSVYTRENRDRGIFSVTLEVRTEDALKQLGWFTNPEDYAARTAELVTLKAELDAAIIAALNAADIQPLVRRVARQVFRSYTRLLLHTPLLRHRHYREHRHAIAPAIAGDAVAALAEFAVPAAVEPVFGPVNHKSHARKLAHHLARNKYKYALGTATLAAAAAAYVLGYSAPVVDAYNTVSNVVTGAWNSVSGWWTATCPVDPILDAAAHAAKLA